MIESAAAAVGDGIIGVTVAEGPTPPDVLVEPAPVEAAPEPAYPAVGPEEPALQVNVFEEPAPDKPPEPATRARRGPLSLAQRLEEMRGMYERRIARKRLIETRLAGELAEMRASIAEDEAELSTLSAGRAETRTETRTDTSE